jgi:hypothetical protein
MKTTISIFNIDTYPSFEDAEASGGVYKTVLNTQDNAVVDAVLNGMGLAVEAVDSQARFEYRIIKEGKL